MSRSVTNNRYIILYDISSNKLRGKIEKTLCDYGMRIQYSVFSVTVSSKGYRRLVAEISRLVSRHPSLCESTDSVFSFKLRSDETIDSIYGKSLAANENYLMIG